MTLILATLNSKLNWFVVADRRLSINGKLCDDHANKSLVVSGPDYYVIVGFTGLARADDWDTAWFLAQRFLGYASLCLPFETVINTLADDLRVAVERGRWLRRTTPAHRHLTIGLFGYKMIGGPSGRERLFQPCAATLCLNDVEVSISATPAVHPGDQFKLGASQYLEPQAELIRRFCTNEVIPEHVQLDYAVEQVRAAAETSERSTAAQIQRGVMPKGSCGPIGDEFTSITLSQSGHHEFSVHSLRDTRGFGPTLIGRSSIVESPRMFKHSRPVWVAPPRFRRATTCPCGRNAQYRHCHGRDGALPPALKYENYDPMTEFKAGQDSFARRQRFSEEIRILLEPSNVLTEAT